MGDDQASRAVGAVVRLGHLWRRRFHPRAHACDHRAHPERDAADAGGASDLRRCLARPRSTRWSRAITTPASATSWRCAATRRRAWAAPTPRALTATRPSAELVASIKKRYPDIEVSVSAYPEKHPQSPDFDADIDTLKAKVDAGATRAITQFFFDNELYNRYVERVRARGIDVPIVPGILPVQNFKQMTNVAARCGASVPSWFAEKFEGLDDDPEARKLVAATVAAGQVQKLNKHGVDNFHFYTMNRADLVFAISHLLGFRANARAEGGVRLSGRESVLAGLVPAIHVSPCRISQ